MRKNNTHWLFNTLCRAFLCILALFIFSPSAMLEAQSNRQHTVQPAVACSITVTNPATTTATNGTPFSQTFTQSGAGAGPVFTLNSGTLPNGLSLSAAGVLSGTPIAPAGTYSITVKVTDGGGCTGTGPAYNLVLSGTFPQMSASLRDALLVDVNSNGQANNGDQLRYTNTIRNTGTGDATGVNFTDTVPVNTTLNPGSRVTSALARDDAFSTFFNTLLNTGNVITNDFGLPSVAVATFGTTASLGTTTPAGSPGTTDNGGTLTVNANGTFNYLPTLGFSGTDKFMYIATTGVVGMPNNDAVVTITVATDITFSTTPVNILCKGASTGSITFTGVSGGSGAGYTYSITGAAGTYQASNIFNGLAAGTYNPAVKDGAGYIKTAANITLTEPATAVSFTHVDVPNTCNGASTGSITITASGGTPGYTYSKNGAGGPFVAGNAFTALTGGTYSISVKDNNGCIVTQAVTLTDPPAVTFTFNKTDVTCFGAGNGIIIFNAPSGGTGPYTYSISGVGGPFSGATNYTGLLPNTYNLVVKDNLGCNSAIQTTTVTEPAQIVVSGTIPNLTYNIAMATATFTKTGGVGSPASPWSISAGSLPTGVSLNTATGDVTGTPLQTGSFSVTIRYTDATNCIGTKAVAFTVAPNLANNTYAAVVGNTQLVAGGQAAPATPSTSDAINILTNDQADVTIVVTAGTFATTNGGSITIDALGKFTYTPLAGSTTADSYVYTGTANGVSATATINFTVTNMVWYVNNTYAGANGVANGESHRPFTTVNAAEAASAVNQYIYVHTGVGNTNGDALLKSGQTLRGAGSTLTVGALTVASGTKPTLTGMITLANNVSVDGFDMNTGATTAITSSGATSVAVAVGNITTSGATNAITLTNTTGSVSNTGGTLTGAAGGAVFNVSGGTATITNAANIVQTLANRAINIASTTGGTITFSGTVSSTGTSTGINLTTNTGATINFTNTLTLNTGANAAFAATGGGTISATGTGSTIITTTATALNVANTAIGAGNLNFQSINSTSASANSAIILNTTGASGGLVVSGTGGAGSGGTISGKTVDALALTSTSNLSLSFMTIQNNTNHGILGTNVNNINLSNCQVLSNATTVPYYGIRFIDATGVVTFTNNTVTGSFNFNVGFECSNSSSAVITSLTVTNGTYSNSTQNGGFLVALKSTAAVNTATFSGVTFNNNFSKGLQLQQNDNCILGNGVGAPATGTITITGCSFSGNNVALSCEGGGGSGGTGSAWFRCVNNNAQTSHSVAMNFADGASSGVGTYKAFISGNTIGTAGTAGSGSLIGEGIRCFMQGQQACTLTIINNVIRQCPNGRGIDIEELGRDNANSGQTACDVKITGNDVNPQDVSGFPQYAIYVAADAQGTGTSGSNVHAEIHGNTVPTPASGPCDSQCGAGFGMIFYETVNSTGTRSGTLFNFGGGATVSAEIANQNTGTAGKTCSFINGGTLTLTLVAVNIVN